MTSQLSRVAACGSIPKCLSSCVGSFPVAGSRSWLLTVTTLQRIARRGNRTQQTRRNGQPNPVLAEPFFHERGPGVGIDLSLQERLDELYGKDNNGDKVDIGFRRMSVASSATRAQMLEWRQARTKREFEKAAREGRLQVDLDGVLEEWRNSGAIFQDIFKAAELYGIYEDLFRHGYFYPCVELNIAYALDDDMLAPVYRGNIIKPSEAASAPEISWDSKEDDLWTLVLTGLDTHLTDEGQEYLHWMTANIKGSDLSSGEELVSYLQPFPPFGTGYHRYAFVLYKQGEMIEFGDNIRPKDMLNLSERTFNTFDFYSAYQDLLTPAGLSFFQSDYDPTLRDFFHNTLNMKEPRYEYEFPLPYIKAWNSWWFGNDKNSSGFNEYMDRRRDPKDIEKEVFLKKLKHTNPFTGDTEKHMKYPLAHEEDLFEIFPTPEYLPDGKTLNPRQSRVMPSWQRKSWILEKSKASYYASTDHKELRRDPPLAQ